LLLIATEEKEELCLEGVGFPVLVKFWQKGVVLNPFEERSRLKLGGQNFG
jgi:hypothetical protein